MFPIIGILLNSILGIRVRWPRQAGVPADSEANHIHSITVILNKVGKIESLKENFKVSLRQTEYLEII